MRSQPLFAALTLAVLGSPALADPCGMVPPVFTGNGPAIERIGAQKTYVFYKDGIESFAIRPGFKGQVEDFGMLIPFPSPPAIRKLPDDFFAHIAAAVDPPMIEAVQLQRRRFARGGGPPMPAPGAPMREESVKVLREEAVGMYEVAVLEAGSARALKRWMDAKGYKYPAGMDGVCQEYVESGWCFVAVKTRVSRKDRTDPQPGQKQPDAGMKPGETFSGNVQAMGFRFQTDELVVPMRLSAFNEGELRNVVYLLAPQGMKIERLPESFVRRQVPGQQLLENLTKPLPVTVNPRWALGVQPGQELPEDAEEKALGVAKQVWSQQWFQRQRDPAPHNRFAKELFAGDLLAAKQKRLSLAHEEQEKQLLGVGEALDLRGPALDALHAAALAELQAKVVEQAVGDLEGMVLTVIDGDFPREVVASANLTFSPFEIPAARNVLRAYDARQGQKPGRPPWRFVYRGDHDEEPRLVAKPGEE